MTVTVTVEQPGISVSIVNNAVTVDTDTSDIEVAVSGIGIQGAKGDKGDTGNFIGDATLIQGIPVDTGEPTLNQVLIFNGSEYVPADQGTSFSLGITGLSDGLSSPVEIGPAGIWKAAGSFSFAATYVGTPNGATISMSGAGNTWSPNSLTLTNSYQGPTVTTQDVNYPAVDSTITFNLAATSVDGNASRSISHIFNNRVYWGVSSIASGYNAANITGLANNALQTGKARSITASPTSSQYILYSHPKRYGLATFTVSGFTGGFQDPETVSVTNGSGYTEDYYVYRSTHLNLGSTSVGVA